MLMDEEVRARVTKILEAKGYAVEAVGSGSGVPRTARLKLTSPEGATHRCVVKVTSSGRISFPYRDGKWTPLHQMDFVAYAHAQADGKLRVQFFRREVLEGAFNVLREVLAAKGKEHIPHWLAPFHEDGERFTGSGFGDKADWTIDIDPEALAVSPPSVSLSEAIDQAKEIIAQALGRSAHEIDLTVAFRS